MAANPGVVEELPLPTGLSMEFTDERLPVAIIAGT
jgi:hypothetical protein